VEAHGGYLCRFEELDAAELVLLARDALVQEGIRPGDCSLLVSALERAKVLRFAYDGAHTYGRRGARWYETHHAFARGLSSVLGSTVHAYVFDPDELEQVVSFGGGRKVGGERLRYEDAELPGDEEGELDERSFEALKERWPLGHLAKVLGIERDELLRIARTPTTLLEFEGGGAKGRLKELLSAAPSRDSRRPAGQSVSSSRTVRARQAVVGVRR
jgi:hypothetical protein